VGHAFAALGSKVGVDVSPVGFHCFVLLNSAEDCGRVWIRVTFCFLQKKGLAQFMCISNYLFDSVVGIT
jgi:hypothetical protein